MFNKPLILLGAGVGITPSLPGTLGLIVQSRESSNLGILSCAHVFLPSASIKPMNVRYFSGLQNTVKPGDAIAEVGTRRINKWSDAAVAWLNPGLTASNTVLGTDITLTGVRTPKIGDILAKVGAETGFTRGRVTEIGYKKVQYGDEVRKIYCMVLEPLTVNGKMQLLAEPGDSGAVWFDEENGLAVGLHFAGEHVARYGPIHAKACLITNVLEELNVELYTGD